MVIRSSHAKFSVLTYGIFQQRLWVIGYEGIMGYGSNFPAHQIGGMKKLWGSKGYGVSGVWVKRGSTVIVISIPKFRLL